MADAVHVSGVVVVIPARDEGPTIGRVVTGCRPVAERVVVVADHCGDDTEDRAREAGAEVWVHEGVAGKGRALCWAWRRLLVQKDWKYLVLLDGDGQHDPGQLVDLLAQAGPGRLVVGDRSPFGAPMPLVRRWTNWVMSALISWRGGVEVRDSQCGYRVVPRRLVEEGRWRGGRFEVESEMILEAWRLGMEVVGVPVSCCYSADMRASHIVAWRDTCRWLWWWGRTILT